jgi:hypothetical protein
MANTDPHYFRLRLEDGDKCFELMETLDDKITVYAGPHVDGAWPADQGVTLSKEEFMLAVNYVIGAHTHTDSEPCHTTVS